MKNKKTELFLFSAWDRTGLEAHLSRMAEKGWLIDKLTSYSLIYRRIEPKKLTFCVCYYPKASAFAPGPTEDQETFYEFCQYAGWELAAEYAQLQMFYNERENPVPIETDPVLELETIHQTMKRSTLPAQILLAVVALLNGGMMISTLRKNPIQMLSSASSLVTGLCWVLVLVLIGAEIIGYFRWRFRAKKAAERGEFLPTTSRVRLQIAALAVVGIVLVYYVLSVFTSRDQVLKIAMPLSFLGMGLLLFLTHAIRNALKRMKVSTNVNRVVTIVSVFVLTYAMIGGITFGVLAATRKGWFAGNIDIYKDEIPLTVEELTGKEYHGEYIRRQHSSSSPLVAQYTTQQSPRFDSAGDTSRPWLSYTVTLVKVPELYDLCKKSLLSRYDGDNGDEHYWDDRAYAPIDAAPWGAVEAYRVIDSETGPWDIYLLCYPDRFVQFLPDEELTPEQMALVGERLGTE